MSEQMKNRRSIPYPGMGTSLVVPIEIWERTLKTMRQFGKKHSEAIVFWGGVITGSWAQITGLYLPCHAAQGARAKLTPEESRWLLRKLRERDEKLIAQIHSHPSLAFHSPGDDEGAASFHTGYLSVVVPSFGRGVSSFSDCAIFEYNGTTFVEVPSDDFHRRSLLLPTIEEGR